MQTSKINTEVVVGAFLLLGIACVSYLAVQLGEFRPLGDDNYRLVARFVSSSGLKNGAYVEVGGVRIGRVFSVALDHESYQAIVELSLDSRVQLQEDSIASIRTSGIIGDKFVKISPGGSDRILLPGEEILETESSINLEELISKYIFESNK